MEGVCPSYYFAVFCTTQSTASAEQWNGGGVANGQATSGVYGAANGGYNANGCNKVNSSKLNGSYRLMEVKEVPAGYKAYQGAVYEPFNDTPPSEAGGKGISGRKNAFPGRPDTGQSKDSPVGEPFVLLLFAAVAVVAWRQKRRAQV